MCGCWIRADNLTATSCLIQASELPFSAVDQIRRNFVQRRATVFLFTQFSALALHDHCYDHCRVFSDGFEHCYDHCRVFSDGFEHCYDHCRVYSVSLVSHLIVPAELFLASDARNRDEDARDVCEQVRSIYDLLTRACQFIAFHC